MPVSYLALCKSCGEEFSPSQKDVEEAPRDEQGQVWVEHFETMYGQPCGGQGRVLGSWGR